MKRCDLSLEDLKLLNDIGLKFDFELENSPQCKSDRLYVGAGWRW